MDHPIILTKGKHHNVVTPIFRILQLYEPLSPVFLSVEYGSINDDQVIWMRAVLPVNDNTGRV